MLMYMIYDYMMRVSKALLHSQTNNTPAFC